MTEVSSGLKENLPGLIVSVPEASIYSVVDVRNIAGEGFDAEKFVLFCAQKGVVDIGGQKTTLLVSPMAGFYNDDSGNNPGLTQMRIAYVAPKEDMKLVPELFTKLFNAYQTQK